MPRAAERQGLRGAIWAPVVWGLHFTLIYVLNALACARGILAGSVPLAIAVATLLALAALAWLAVPAWRGDGSPWRQSPFLRRFGLGLCGLAALAIAWNLLPVLLVPACAAPLAR